MPEGAKRPGTTGHEVETGGWAPWAHLAFIEQSEGLTFKPRAGGVFWLIGVCGAGVDSGGGQLFFSLFLSKFNFNCGVSGSTPLFAWCGKCYGRILGIP